MVPAMVPFDGHADRLGGAGSDHRPGAFRQRAGCVDPAAQLPYAGTCCQAAAGHTGILYHLLEHLPADISAVGWSIGRGCSRRMGTLPLEISRARGRAGAVPYFNVAAVPGHYGAYLTINHLGLMDTVWAVILPGAFSTFPVFVMQRGFDAVPLPLLEAAAIDGATPWQQFARIGLPVGLPGILAALTMSFLDAWNALEQPMTFLKTQSLWSLSLYLTDTTRDLALTMAASLFALLPAVLIFAFGQKYLEQGILAGAVKG